MTNIYIKYKAGLFLIKYMAKLMEERGKLAIKVTKK